MPFDTGVPVQSEARSNGHGALREVPEAGSSGGAELVKLAYLADGIVHVQYRGRLTDDALRRHHEALESLMTEKTRVAVILDMTRSMGLSPAQARIQAGWVRRQRDNLAFCAGLAFVLPNVAQRAVMKSILRIAPLGCPYTVASDVAEAKAFCEQQLGRLP